MKERLKRKQPSAWVGILTIVGLFLLIIALHLLLTYIGWLFEFTYVEYIEYALFILIGILIIRKWLTEYEYIVVDDELFVDRYLGKRPKRLFGVKFSHIKHIGSELPESCSSRKQRLTFLSRRKGVVYLVYIAGDNQKCAYFSPSDKMLDLIKTRMQNK